MEYKEAWWERPLMLSVAAIFFAGALWMHYDAKSRQPIGFVPSGYAEEDVTDVRIAVKATLHCWLEKEGNDCFAEHVDFESPFEYDLLRSFWDVPTYHQLGQPYKVDVKALGTLMGMDWPEEERRDFANSRDFQRDGMAIVFVTGTDLSFLEPRWQERVCDGCALPYLKQQRMAEVRTVIKPAHGLPGATIVLYLRATEMGWLLFDWQAS